MASALVMLAIVVILRLHAWGVNPLRMMTRFVRKPWFERLLLLIVICGMVHYGATKGTGGGSRSTDGDARTNPSEDVSRRNPARDAGLRQSDEITNLCFTGICVQTNGVILDVAWPTNMFTAGTTLDFFAEYPALTNDWRWFLARETLPGETNMTVFADMVDGLGIQPPPATMFFKVQDRHSCATSMTDSDGDGLSDSAEIAMGTNPRDLYSFYRRVTVITTASDGLLNMTNYVAWGVSEECWETNGLTAWSLLPSTNVFEVMSTNGPMVVKAYRDLNRNGRYDAEADILLAEQVPPLDAVSRFELRFGDVDGDGWSDGLEIAHGADPFNARNYCFNLSFVEKGIFSTTNQLTAEVLLGTNVLLGPVVMTNRTWACDLGHLIVSNRETIVVYFWDDANSNGVRDVEECSTKQTIPIRGHENVITNTLALGAFDRDGDGMLDYWEVLHANAGLSPTNAADAFLDSDQDGLINLHEFWADCDPMFFDGTNTLLSIASLSVDLYLCCGSNVTSVLPRFENYQQNGSNLVFTANTLFWAINCDFGCCSMWNDSMRDMWGGPCCQWNMAGTAISSRHILHSHHYGIPNGTTLYFYGHISGVVSRRLINSIYVGGDLRVGVLDSDLPFDIIPAMVIPSGYESYIGKGTGLPVVTFDQEEMLSVAEISALQDYSARDMDTCAMIPQKRLRQPYYRNIVSGDSGNPRFLVVGNRIALINLLWHGGAGGGCFITHFAESIQLAMDALAAGYPLEFLDLSQYDMLPSWR